MVDMLKSKQTCAQTRVDACKRTGVLCRPLQAILRRSLKPTCCILPLMKRGHANNLEYFLSHIGKAYVNGSVMSPSSA